MHRIQTLHYMAEQDMLTVRYKVFCVGFLLSHASNCESFRECQIIWGYL